MLAAAGGAAGLRARGGCHPRLERAGACAADGVRTWRNRQLARGAVVPGIDAGRGVPGRPAAGRSEPAGRNPTNRSSATDARRRPARGARRARQGLIVAEVALAVMLAIGAGLLLRSFLNLQRVDTGVDANAVMTMRLTLPQEKYPDRRGDHRVLRRARAARRSAAQRGARGPRVAVSSTGVHPHARIDRRPRRREEPTLPTAYATVASRGYFEAVGMTRCAPAARSTIAIARARRASSSSTTRSCRGISAGRAPLGARIRIGDKPEQATPAELIGVVANTANVGAGFRAGARSVRADGTGIATVEPAVPGRKDRGRSRLSGLGADPANGRLHRSRSAGLRDPDAESGVRSEHPAAAGLDRAADDLRRSSRWCSPASAFTA